MQSANYLIPLITFPYLTRVLGVSQFGIYAFILTLSQYFVLFTDFGFNLSASKKIAQAGGDEKLISDVYWGTLLAKLIIGLFCCLVVFLIFILNVGEGKEHGVIFLILIISGSVFTPIWFFQGVERLSSLAVINIFSKVMSIPLIFIFVVSKDDVGLAVLIQGIVALISAVISQLLVYHSGIVSKLNVRNIKVIEELRASFPLFISSVAISLYTMSTPIILGVVSNSYELGLYTAVDRLRGAVLGVFLVVGGAIYPRVNNLFISDRVGMYALLRKVIMVKFVFSITAIFFIYYYASDIICLVLGDSFIEAEGTLRVMSVQFFTVLFSVFFANYLLLPFGYQKIYMLLPIFTCMLHVVLCYFLAKMLGSLGGAISVTLVELVSMLILAYVTYSKGLPAGMMFKNRSTDKFK